MGCIKSHGVKVKQWRVDSFECLLISKSDCWLHDEFRVGWFYLFSVSMVMVLHFGEGFAKSLGLLNISGHLLLEAFLCLPCVSMTTGTCEQLREKPLCISHIDSHLSHTCLLSSCREASCQRQHTQKLALHCFF